MKQQSHSSERARCFDVICHCKMIKSDVSNGVTRCNVVLMLERRYRYIHVNVCETVQLFVGFLQCNGGKFENAKVFKGVFVVYFVFESK